MLQGEWDVAVRYIADSVGAPVKQVEEAWVELRDEMVLTGKRALADGLLDEDFVASIPPELIVGLTALAVLEIIRPSPPGEVRFESGLRLTDRHRPRSAFADRAWKNVKEAQAASMAFRAADARNAKLLHASILGGGGEVSSLPTKLAEAILELGAKPIEEQDACQQVQRPLIALAIDCSQHPTFKKNLMEVINSLLESAPLVGETGGSGNSLPSRDHVGIEMVERPLLDTE
eukprot:TRINITY_DN27617_c0_g1_i1.p1 TRINITY_DN27617_c0_g1~~TRINITY_DN27617_c0_g1_i1.p1  ORF type:complete len:232 (+),score=53.16 TRINITY_DN27617_c0_g1_i1:286-981(+)